MASVRNWALVAMHEHASGKHRRQQDHDHSETENYRPSTHLRSVARFPECPQLGVSCRPLSVVPDLPRDLTAFRKVEEAGPRIKSGATVAHGRLTVDSQPRHN